MEKIIGDFVFCCVNLITLISFVIAIIEARKETRRIAITLAMIGGLISILIVGAKYSPFQNQNGSNEKKVAVSKTNKEEIDTEWKKIYDNYASTIPLSSIKNRRYVFIRAQIKDIDGCKQKVYYYMVYKKIKP